MDPPELASEPAPGYARSGEIQASHKSFPFSHVGFTLEATNFAILLTTDDKCHLCRGARCDSSYKFCIDVVPHLKPGLDFRSLRLGRVHHVGPTH